MKKFPSKFNNKVELVQDNNGYSLLVDGITQSGIDIEAIWDQAFERLIPPTKNIISILILGFGAGSIVIPLKKNWPAIKITAVEIDPEMIKIAKEYFPNNLLNVKLFNQDAVEYVKSLPPKLSFDLVIVDCYIGGVEPESIKTIKFLLKLKKIGKRVLFNQLFLPNDRKEMKKIEFLKILDQSYPIQALKLPYNIIIEF